jgi:hypothetical protein
MVFADETEIDESLSEVQDLERQKQNEERPQPGQPQKIAFSPDQQEKVNQLIRDAQGRAAKELRVELDRTKAELEAARTLAPKTDSGAVELAAQVSELRAERDTLRRERADSILTADLLSVAGAEEFHDTDLATRLMRDHVRLAEDGKPVVVNADGTPRLNANLDPMTLGELARAVATERPFLVRSSVRSGSGGVESRSKVEPFGGLDKLFGPGASKDAAAQLNRMALRDPQRYRSMRRQAVEKGLIRQ